jgi:hypothetical protein
MTALKTAKNVNLDGVIPAWTPNAPGPKGFARAGNPDYYFGSYKNGKPYLLTPKPVNITEVLAGKGIPAAVVSGNGIPAS